MAGGALQLVYGVLAVVWPYPQIIVPALELVWGLVNLGMVAGIVAWLAIDVARPRWLALIGGGVAIVGHLVRLAVSIWIGVQPNANLDSVNTMIVASIVMMFGGMALLAIGTAVGRRLPGLGRWAPGLVLATGLMTAAFYSLDKVTHFVLLGLFVGCGLDAAGVRSAPSGDRARSSGTSSGCAVVTVGGNTQTLSCPARPPKRSAPRDPQNLTGRQMGRAKGGDAEHVPQADRLVDQGEIGFSSRLA